MPTSSRSPLCGSGAIQRTCDVHGRGGYAHEEAEGTSRNASSASQSPVPSGLRNSALGSQPA